jgi:hypothetical protein
MNENDLTVVLPKLAVASIEDCLQIVVDIWLWVGQLSTLGLLHNTADINPDWARGGLHSPRYPSKF